MFVVLLEQRSEPWRSGRPSSPQPLARWPGRAGASTRRSTFNPLSDRGLERAWMFDTGGPIQIADGIAVAGSWDDRIYGVDVLEGSEAWSVRGNGYPRRPVGHNRR